MAFDVEEMVRFSVRAISAFASHHRHETFYGFSIDDGLLCLNTEESFEETLASYQEKFPKYYFEAEKISSLRVNTGDWLYQGFADLSECTGYNPEAYNIHYAVGLENGANSGKLKNTDYALAIDQLLHRLRAIKAFDGLNKTNDFFVTHAEHEY